MNRWMAFDLFDYEIDFCETEPEAQDVAEKWLEEYRADAPTDGWPEDMEGMIGYAKCKAGAVMTKHETKEEHEARGEEWPYSEKWDEIFDYELRPIGEEKRNETPQT